MSIIVDEVTAPSAWLPYLVYGNPDSLEQQDRIDCDKWMESILPFYVVSDIEDSNRFTWSGHLYGSSYNGVEVSDYVVHSIKDST